MTVTKCTSGWGSWLMELKWTLMFAMSGTVVLKDHLSTFLARLGDMNNLQEQIESGTGQ